MPAALEDPTQPPHYRPDVVTPNLEPYTVLLKDRETTATIYPITAPDQLPIGLLAFLCDEFNMEIERGDTFPLFDTLHIDTFQNYWFGSFAGVMLIGDAPTIQNRRQWEKECLGTFYIKPNYPGRCAHICTAGFLVNAGIRGKGIGRTLAECYLEWAPKLGYTYSVFNLVFETNVLARRIWETLNFKRIGRIKAAGILKGLENAVDAIIYGRDLGDGDTESVGELRFDKIRFYLETGRYPPRSDRQEKSRLRSSAAHYKLRDGKLMLKNREVISDPERQLQIATELHLVSHAGINKTTSLITESYHWTRIKDTVAVAIRNCAECRESTRPNQRRHSVTPDHDFVRSINGLDDIAAATAAAAVVSTSADASTSNSASFLPNENDSHQQFESDNNQLRDPADAAKKLGTNATLLTPIGLALGPDVDEKLIAVVTAHQQRQLERKKAVLAAKEEADPKATLVDSDSLPKSQIKVASRLDPLIRNQGEIDLRTGASQIDSGSQARNPTLTQARSKSRTQVQSKSLSQAVEHGPRSTSSQPRSEASPVDSSGHTSNFEMQEEQQSEEQSQTYSVPRQSEVQLETELPTRSLYHEQDQQEQQRQQDEQEQQQLPQSQYQQYQQFQQQDQQQQQQMGGHSSRPLPQLPQLSPQDQQQRAQFRHYQQQPAFQQVQHSLQYSQYTNQQHYESQTSPPYHFQHQQRLPPFQDPTQQHVSQLQSSSHSREANPNPPYGVNSHQSLQRPPPPIQQNRLPSISSQQFPETFSHTTSFQTANSALDPQMESFDDQNPEDIAIARALITENSGDEDGTNMFTLHRA
ncbi:Spt10p [Sugiyamaella lignohabitans]|uniref:Spt10p n=1 Tax=Sugiyamaella lignohabitans TaxID=796027 RepID=A0A167FTI7_9ASCO|nr:Spt10p [Sugiyamaella lignohabitans]ANB15684.1 Spt10p [Sugiyamaella lignohabitans]